MLAAALAATAAEAVAATAKQFSSVGKTAVVDSRRLRTITGGTG